MSARLRLIVGGQAAGQATRQHRASESLIADMQLPKLSELQLEFDPSYKALWCVQHHVARPNFTLSLIDDISAVQSALKRDFPESAGGDQPIKYLVWSSAKRNIFNLGGDLVHFVSLLEARDREGMHAYAKACIDICFTNYVNMHLPVTTIALATGDALGGGLESALSSDIFIAERGAQFGFPEILFGLFPGMGAYSLVTRRAGAKTAERMIFSGRIFSAEDLYEMGLVDVLADEGRGEDALHDYLRRNDKRFEAHRAIYDARRISAPLVYREMEDIAARWVDTALSLGRLDLRKMQRLAKAQMERVKRDQKPHKPAGERSNGKDGASLAGVGAASKPAAASEAIIALPLQTGTNQGATVGRERGAPRSGAFEHVIDSLSEARATVSLQPGVKSVLSEGMSGEDYVAWLGHFRHLTSSLPELMTAAAGRCNGTDGELRTVLQDVAVSAKGFSDRLRQRAAAFGGDPASIGVAPPAAPLQALMGYNANVSERKSPWAVLGVAYVMDDIADTLLGRISTADSQDRVIKPDDLGRVADRPTLGDLVNRSANPDDCSAIVETANVNYTMIGAFLKASQSG